MTTQYNQGAPLYNSNNTTALQIPSIVFSTTSNSYQNITVPPQNIIKISTNLATSMTKMVNYTTTIPEINLNLTAAIGTWNSNPANANQQLTPQSSLPILTQTTNYFENGNQVMDFNVFGHLFFSNGSKRAQPNYYYNNIASFNTNCLTYANSVSNYNPISLSSLVTNQICANNNVGINSLDSSITIDLHNSLKHYTNLNNLIGNYRCLDIEALYNSFTGYGYVKYDLDYNNVSDAKPNVYGGALIQLINRYNIYVSVPNIVPSSTATASTTVTATTSTTTPPTTTPTTSTTTPPTSTTTPIPGIDNYQIQLDVSYLTYFSNLVSQSQISSNTSQNNVLSIGTTVSGLTIPSTQQISTSTVPVSFQTIPSSSQTLPTTNS
jgi:hypothetical protein